MQTSHYLQITEVCIVLQVIKTMLFLSLDELRNKTNYDLAKANNLLSYLLLLSEANNFGIVHIFASLIQC
jgi:hypothetical protein